MRARSASQAGLTIIELVIGMLILGIAGSITVRGLVSGMSLARDTGERAEAIAEVEKSLERIARELRAADGLIIDPGGEVHAILGADVYRDNKQYRYEFHVEDAANGVEIQVDRYVRSGGSETLLIANEVLATNLDAGYADGSERLFRYYDGNGVEVTDSCHPSAAHYQSCIEGYLVASSLEIDLERGVDGASIQAGTTVHIRSSRLGQ